MSREPTVSANPIALTAMNSISQGLTLPKIGTLIPNRIFVGGISSTTTDDELRSFFSIFGPVKDVKVIYDKSGLSKGSYGFVTFEDQQTAEAIIKNEAETLMFKDRKLNIGYAVRKQHIFQKHEIGSTLLVAHNACSLTNGISLFQLCPHEHPILAMNQSAVCYPTTLMVPSGLSSPQIFAGGGLPAGTNHTSNNTMNSHNVNQFADVGNGSISVNGFLFTPALTANSMTTHFGNPNALQSGQSRAFQSSTSCWKQDCSSADPVTRSCFGSSVGKTSSPFGCDPIHTIPTSCTMAGVLGTKSMQSTCSGHSVQQATSPETCNIWSSGNTRNNMNCTNAFMGRLASDGIARHGNFGDHNDVRQSHVDSKSSGSSMSPLTQSSVLLMATSTDPNNLTSFRVKSNESGTLRSIDDGCSLFALKSDISRVAPASATPHCFKCRSNAQGSISQTVTNDKLGFWQQEKPDQDVFMGPLINPNFTSSGRLQSTNQGYTGNEQHQMKTQETYPYKRSSPTVNMDSHEASSNSWFRQLINAQPQNYQSPINHSVIYQERVSDLREAENHQLDDRGQYQSAPTVFRSRNINNRYTGIMELSPNPSQPDFQSKTELDNIREPYTSSINAILDDNQQSNSKQCSPIGSGFLNSESDQLYGADTHQSDHSTIVTPNAWFSTLPTPNSLRGSEGLSNDLILNRLVNDRSQSSDVQDIKLDRPMLVNSSSATTACGDISKQRTS